MTDPRNTYLSTCPRRCGVSLLLHRSSDLVDGGCDTSMIRMTVAAGRDDATHGLLLVSRRTLPGRGWVPFFEDESDVDPALREAFERMYPPEEWDPEGDPFLVPKDQIDPADRVDIWVKISTGLVHLTEPGGS